MLDLWAACRTPGSMLGPPMTRLPFDGGVLGQPAALMDAFRIIDGLMAAE